VRSESESSSIVLDASAAVDLLLSRGDEGRWAGALVAGADVVAVPELVDFEIVSAVRGLALGGVIGAKRGAQALDDFGRLRMLRYSGTQLLRRMWELRGHVDAFDAAYIALAEALRLPLITTDQRLARAGGHRAEVVAFEG
jgi:predicted nucleic acid-binding protein